jgi:iron(II)-dependent oxidoreductase
MSRLPPAATIREWAADARQRTFELVADLDDHQLLGPRLSTVNPLLWEIGHVAWFQEKWALRHALGEQPIRADGDPLWDSAAVAHGARWDLPLPTREGALAYMGEVRDRVLDRLIRHESDPRLLYFALYSVFHEDMHGEPIGR